jgi:hypothetical protein
MRRTFALIIAVGLTAALLALPGAALGRAAFTEYTGTETRAGPPEIDFENAHGTKVVQVGFYSEWNDVTTDPRTTGLTKVTGSLTLTDPATFTGIMRGTSVTEVDHGPGVQGTWVGSWQGTLVGGVGFFKAVAHGTGDFAGMQMKATFTGVDLNTVRIEGRILDPLGG